MSNYKRSININRGSKMIEVGTRQISFMHEICTQAGTPYPCLIYYTVQGNAVLDHGVKFDFGYYDYDNGYIYLPEIVEEIICKDAGTNQLVFETDLNIED